MISSYIQDLLIVPTAEILRWSLYSIEPSDKAKSNTNTRSAALLLVKLMIMSNMSDDLTHSKPENIEEHVQENTRILFRGIPVIR